MLIHDIPLLDSGVVAQELHGHETLLRGYGPVVFWYPVRFRYVNLMITYVTNTYVMRDAKL